MSSSNDSYLESEREKWDSLATQAAAKLKPLSADASWERYCAETATMVGVAEFLGPLGGKRVLEYGCGMGAISVLLAKAGAELTSFDISPGSVEVTRQRLKLNGFDAKVEAADAHQLPYPDGQFDLVFGKAILHHLDPVTGAPELLRQLAPGGRAAFVEPMGMNPVLNFVRDHVPYPHKNPPGGDKPVDYRDIALWEAGYSFAEHTEIQLTSMLERGLGFNRPLPALRRLDSALLQRVPPLRRLCRYAVIKVIR